ncbi:hypothetical protein BG000_005304 [Podila horticola]|nr:hypothetical protein BG000_005304 [Podila horticola]
MGLMKTLMEGQNQLQNEIEVLKRASPMAAILHPEIARPSIASAHPSANDSATSDKVYKPDDEASRTLQPLIQTPTISITLNQSVSEAYKHRFTGNKFSLKATDALEGTNYFGSHLATHTWDRMSDIQENVSMWTLGEAHVKNVDDVYQLAVSIDVLRECKQEKGENTKTYLLRFEQALTHHHCAMAKKRLLPDELLIRQALYAGVASAKIAKAVMKARTLTQALAVAKSITEEESRWSCLGAEKSETTGATSETTGATSKTMGTTSETMGATSKTMGATSETMGATLATMGTTPATAEKDINHDVSTPEALLEVTSRSATLKAPKSSSDGPTDATMNALVMSMDELHIIIDKQSVPTNKVRSPGAPQTHTCLNESDVVGFNCDQKGHCSNECSQPATRNRMAVPVEYDNIEAEQDPRTFAGRIYLIEEDYHERACEQPRNEKDFYQGW